MASLAARRHEGSRAGSRALPGPVTVTSPGRSLVSARSVRRAGLLCLSLGRELSALSHAAVHRTMAIVLSSHGYLDILT